MKQLIVFVTVFTILASINSCKKDENKTNDPIDKETISAKWIVDGTSDYESFEFNLSGNYIIVKEDAKKSKNELVVLFGTYEIIDDKTIILSDFGKIIVSEVGENTISFLIVLDSDPDNKISINAIKKDEMQTSTRTELLCRTWELVTVDGEDVAGTDMELTVLFSAAGTYFVSFANPEGENDGGLAQWKWKDGNEIILCYSWEGEPTCDGTHEVEISELTTNKLKIIEYEMIYVLRPASNRKSAIISSGNFLDTKSINRFFKK